MGLSFDEDSAMEASIGSLRFAASDVVNSITEEAGNMGSIVNQERRDEIRSSNHSDVGIAEIVETERIIDLVVR